MDKCRIELNRLLSEERRLIKQCPATAIPLGSISVKKHWRSHKNKDGTISVYEYDYPYLIYQGRHIYLTQADYAEIRPLIPIRNAILRLQHAISALIRSMNRLLRGSERLDEEQVRQEYFASEEQLHRDEEPSASEEGIVTECGEGVKSRCECILANELYSLGIPYRYEACVQITEEKMRRPDFTLLVKGRPLYIELMGMVDHPSYDWEQKRKLEDYRSVGIRTGENLVLLKPKTQRSINSRVLRSLFLRLAEGFVPKKTILI